MIATMPNANERNRLQSNEPKLNVTVRLAPSLRDAIDTLAQRSGRSRSDLIELGVLEISDLTPEEISRRILKRAAKAK
jgi:predicted transcriptional regulator